MFKNGKKDPLLEDTELHNELVEDVEVSDEETMDEDLDLSWIDEIEEAAKSPALKKAIGAAWKQRAKKNRTGDMAAGYTYTGGGNPKSPDWADKAQSDYDKKRSRVAALKSKMKEDVDEAWDPANGPAQAVAAVKAATQVGKKQPLRKGDKQNSDPMVKLSAAGAFKEDLDALVDSEATLSEAFREKAEVIFESALQAKLSEHVNRLEEAYAEQLGEELNGIQSDLVEKIDGYLNYVVENWIEENKVAIENGLRTEIAESFMQALHGVFTEHYITVPESKVDVVDELALKVDELEEQLNSALERGIELTEQVKSLARDAVIRESATDLSEAQADKLATLTEGVEFESAETFAKKVSTIKESYFKKEAVKQSTDEAENLTEDMKTVEVSPVMARYLAALKK
jgi:hypothetical protein